MQKAQKIEELKETILRDIKENNRSFLHSGNTNGNGSLFDKAILLDGLDLEEAMLIQSTLPTNIGSLFLFPLDKGFSGSKVMGGQYEDEKGFPSKTFVFKIGAHNKIEPEFDATTKHVVPYINGVETPVFRKGKEKSLVTQAFAGLSKKDELISLKKYSKQNDDLNYIIKRIFEDRFSPWYTNKVNDVTKNRTFRELFNGYIQKFPQSSKYPSEWDMLKEWVKNESEINADWIDPQEVLDSYLDHYINFNPCTVHGDFHTENILVSKSKECWPIDFAQCHDDGTILIDLTMLECSLKFNALPKRSQLRSMLKFEDCIIDKPYCDFQFQKVPYCTELNNIKSGINTIRKIAIDEFGFSFEEYLKALYITTYLVTKYEDLNQPFIWGSLQMLGNKIIKS